MRNEFAIAAMTMVAGVVTLGIILASRHQLPIGQRSAKLAGFIVLYSGIALLLWAGFHLGAAIAGTVSPRLESLVVTGPYAIVRHPAYLGTTVAMLGAAIVARSAFGLLAVAVVFLPVEIHRARLEERALAEKFGDGWTVYASRVGFFLPRIR